MPRGGSKPGERRGGRQKGTPNKIGKTVREMILGALDKAGGEKYLLEQAKENPKSFLTLVGRVLPLQVTGPNGEELKIKATIELVRAKNQTADP